MSCLSNFLMLHQAGAYNQHADHRSLGHHREDQQGWYDCTSNSFVIFEPLPFGSLRCTCGGRHSGCLARSTNWNASDVKSWFLRRMSSEHAYILMTGDLKYLRFYYFEFTATSLAAVAIACCRTGAVTKPQHKQARSGPTNVHRASLTSS